MVDQIIYNDQLVTVTTSRIMIRGTTYALRNITSVRAHMTPANKSGAFVLILFGVIFAFCGFGGISSDDTTGLGVLFLLGGVAAIVGAVFWIRSLKPMYHLLLASASGETSAFSSYDPGYINYLVNCINEAIVRYQ